MIFLNYIKSPFDQCYSQLSRSIRLDMRYIRKYAAQLISREIYVFDKMTCLFRGYVVDKLLYVDCRRIKFYMEKSEFMGFQELFSDLKYLS